MKKITSLLMLFFVFVGAAFAQVEEGKAYYLKVATLTDAYVDTKTAHGDNHSSTIKVTSEPVRTYFKAADGGAWYISVDSECNGGFLTVERWCANPNQANGDAWFIEEAESGVYYLTQSEYQGGNDANRKYLGREGGVALDEKLYTDQAVANALKVSFVEAPEQVALKSIGELSNNYVCYLESSRGTLIYNPDNSGVLSSTKAYSNISATSKNAEWVIYKNESKYYIYSLLGKKFIGQATSEGGRFPLTNAPEHDVQIVNSTKDGYPFVFSTDNYGAINQFNHTAAPGVANWRGNDSQGGLRSLNDDGSAHKIYKVRELTEEELSAIEELFNSQREFTYTFKYNGEVKYTQNCIGSAGQEYPEITITLPYGVEATKPSGNIPNEITNVDIELTVVKELPFVTAATVEDITSWYYIHMHTNQFGYLGDIADDKSINVGYEKSSDVANENFVWGFVGDVFGGITMVNKAGLQITSSGNGNVTATDNGTSFFIAATGETTTQSTNGFCLRKKDSDNYINANHTAGKLQHWSAKDAGSTMIAIPYTEFEVNVTEAGYATLYLGEATYIPAGVEVYTINSIENEWANMTQLEVGTILPANTGVILKNAGTYAFANVAKDNVAALEGNLLSGSVVDTYVHGPAYVLANGEAGIGLYPAELNKNENGETGDTHFLNNAGKAYLSTVLPVKALRFNFGGNTTAIESVVAPLFDANAPIYDLSGRRVVNAVKGGLYIQNGKKFIVK